MAKSKVATKLTPKQIEIASALLAFSNMGLGVTIKGNLVNLDDNGTIEITKATPRNCEAALPMEIDGDGYEGECKFFVKDLKKDSIKEMMKCWGDIIGPVVEYIKE
jgi:hypothetical protein